MGESTRNDLRITQAMMKGGESVVKQFRAVEKQLRELSGESNCLCGLQAKDEKELEILQRVLKENGLDPQLAIAVFAVSNKTRQYLVVDETGKLTTLNEHTCIKLKEFLDKLAEFFA